MNVINKTDLHVGAHIWFRVNVDKNTVRPIP